MNNNPINNQGGFWWFFDDDTSDENTPVQTDNSLLNNQTKPVSTLPNQTTIEIKASPWWKFWDDDSSDDDSSDEEDDSDSSDEEDNEDIKLFVTPKSMSENEDSDIFITSTSKPVEDENIKEYEPKKDKINNEKVKKLIELRKKMEEGNSNSHSFKLYQDDTKEAINKNIEVKKQPIKKEIPIIESNNKKIMIFISNLCNHRLNDNIVSNVYNLINSNKKLFEEEPVRLSILKYRLCNHISNYEKIENLFFDIGFNDNIYDTDFEKFQLDYIIDIGNNKNIFQKREVIIFDEEHDTNLRDIIKKVNNFEKNDQLYKNVIGVIVDYMNEESNDFKFNKFMAATAFKYKTNSIYIGDIDCGLDRHKSLLFKYLCDNLNLQCSLLRNNKMDLNGNIYDDHVWNLILLKGKVYVVDFKYFPNRIVHPNNSETSKYYNIRKFMA